MNFSRYYSGAFDPNIFYMEVLEKDFQQRIWKALLCAW